MIGIISGYFLGWGTKLYDVVVVGGGPVGSYVAYKLAEMGYGVVVVERKERLGGPVCCTGIISQECVGSFAVDDSVILRRVNSARLFSPSGRALSLLWQGKTVACIVNRAAFDAAMVSRARGKGVEYVLNSLVRGIDVRDNRVNIEATRQGERLNFEARAVVMANGFGSRLSEELGLGTVGDFVIGAQAVVENGGVDEIEVYFDPQIAPAFFAWLVPTSSQRALVGLLSRRSPELYLRKLISFLQAQGKINSAVAEPCYRGIPIKPLPRTYGNRLVAVGDAAGQVKPTTCGGVYYGLLCADIAANNLHRALESDDLSAKSLANYERGWKRRLGRELRIGYWARKFYERLSDRQIDRIFEIMESSNVDEALLKAGEFSFDWHGKALLQILGHTAVSKAIGVIKIPFR